jgi:hypothetical protein
MIPGLVRPLAAALVLLAAAWVWRSGGELPASVATKFGRGGLATHHEAREAYRALMTGAVLLLPFLMVLLQTWLPRRFPRLSGIPRWRYWLEPERREATLEFLEGLAWFMGLLAAGWFTGFHALILRANASRPPAFDTPALLVLTLGMVLGAIAAPVALSLRFRRPR